MTDRLITRAFSAQITGRCEEAPVAVELEEVGAYRLLGP